MPDSPHLCYFVNLGVLPRKISGVTVLREIEANVIGDNGELDVDERLLKSLEWIVASMHRDCYKLSTAENHTNSYLKLAQNPYVDVIGHCTTSPFPFDYEKGVKAFKEYGKLVEVNESSILSARSPAKNAVELLKLCKKYEVPVVFDSDCHYCELIGQTPILIKMAEELDFPEKLVMNTDWEKIKEYVLVKRPNLDINILKLDQRKERPSGHI